MKNKNQIFNFLRLLLQYKLFFSIAALVSLVGISLILVENYLQEFFLWISFLFIILSIFLSYIISHSVRKHYYNVANIINEYCKGNFAAISEISQYNEFGELKNSLNKLSESFKSNIDEKIANENLAMMGEFATFILHDLKNPISGIHLLAEGLNKKVSSNNDLKKYSQEILLASQKLDDFIKRTLDIAKPTTLTIQSLLINQLIENIVSEINLSEIEIETRLDVSIEEISGDYQLLSRAITNIINNAIESIEIEGKIIIETKNENNIIIKISDNGNGIDETNINNIFRPFYSSKGKGHGLGLAMAKKAILMHHGSIEVESKTGSGSIFTISLPRFPKQDTKFNLKK